MIGKRLKAARIAAGMTQVELAKKTGIDEDTVSRVSHYERGTHSPNFQQACLFAEVLEVPECYLYCRDDILADQILSIYKRNKKYKITASEIVILENAGHQLKMLQETINKLLQDRIEIEIDSELPKSLKL